MTVSSLVFPSFLSNKVIVYQLNVSEDLSYPQEHFKLYAKK